MSFARIAPNPPRVVFRFALVNTDREALGEAAFARGDWKTDGVIPQGRSRLKKWGAPHRS